MAKFPLRYQGSERRQLGGYPTRTGQVPFDDIVHRKDISRTVVLGVDFESKDIAGEYEVHLAHYQNPGGIIVEERLEVTTRQGNAKASAKTDGTVDSTLSIPSVRLRTPRFLSLPFMMFKSRDAEESRVGHSIQQALWDRIGVYRFDPTALKTPAEVGKGLTATGYNFATYLDQIRNEPGGKQEFDALLERFRLACPHVEDILLPFDERSADRGDERGERTSPRKRIALVMPSSSPPIPADLESDGTILLLAYASLLHGSRAHDTICVEEPENGIHPAAIPAQVKMLKQLTQPYGDRPGAQILVCTHSRKFFHEVEDFPGQLRLVRRGADGRSSVEGPSRQQVASLAAWAGLV